MTDTESVEPLIEFETSEGWVRATRDGQIVDGQEHIDKLFDSDGRVRVDQPKIGWVVIYLSDGAYGSPEYRYRVSDPASSGRPTGKPP